MSRRCVLGVCLWTCAVALPVHAGPTLVIAASADDAAVRQALGAVGVEQVSPLETTQLLVAAAGSGLVCAPGDTTCWLRVAQLAGHDAIVLVTDDELLMSGAAGSRRVPRLVPGDAGIDGAVKRLVGGAGAVVVVVDPATAIVSIDGVVGSGLPFDGVIPGMHLVEAAGPGLVTRQESVAVVDGEVVSLAWTLAPQPVAEASLAPTLVWGGVGAVGLGLVAGSTLATVGWYAGGCTFDPFTCGEGKKLADAFSVAGIGVGAGLAVVGLASMLGASVVD